jgi:Flp pilus assembly protein TadB
MSKKATRRAARQAFPELKNPAPARSRFDTRATNPRGSKSRSSASQALKTPTLKRAAIQGFIVAALYFIFIQWIWKSGAAPAVNLFYAAGGFVLYTGVAYWVDKFKYQRKLRKLKGSSK